MLFPLKWILGDSTLYYIVRGYTGPISDGKRRSGPKIKATPDREGQGPTEGRRNPENEATLDYIYHVSTAFWYLSKNKKFTTYIVIIKWL